MMKNAYYKFIPVALAVVVFLVGRHVFADSSSSISVDSSFVPGVWAQAQALWDGFSSIIEMIVGVIIALVVIEEIIGALRKPH